MSDDDLRRLDQENQQLRRLVELSVTLNSTLDLEALLQLITGTATELLDCEAASILLYDEQQPHLYFAAATGSDSKKLAEIPVPIEGSLAGTIFRTNHPIIINEPGQDPRHYSLVSEHIQFRVRTLLGVPMRIKQRVTGVLEAVNKQKGVFTGRDETILSVIAAHAAIAINNARLLQATQNALQKIQEADRVKSNFLAVASHELRTPLGIIIGYASFLREEAKGELSEHAEHALNAALQMRALVEDMTNLTMLETKGMMLNKTRRVSIQSILKTACEETLQLALAKEQEFDFEMQDEPIMVEVDPEKLTTAVLNVLNNAVRFSPSGSRIRVGAAEQGGQAIAWVQDHGIGIPPEELSQIFDGFHQAENPNTRHYGGLGIGLTIARGLVTAQGGKIWAESEGVGKGSSFKISLPKA